MAIPTKVYPLTIPAGGAFPLQCYGTYFKVMSASGTFKVTGDVFGELGAILPGQGLRMDAKDPPFQRLTFIDTSGLANNLVIVVADDTFVDDRVTGDVTVIDGSKSQVIADAAFMFATVVAANVAGVSSLALLNPAGSGKRAIIKSLSFAPGATPNTVRTGQYNSAQAWGAGTAGFSKRIPSGATVPAASTCKVDSKNIFGVGAPIASLFESFQCATLQSQVRTFDRPVVVEPGGGYAIDVSVVNVSLLASLEWTEELVP